MFKSLAIIGVVIAVMLAFKFFSGNSESAKKNQEDGKKFLDENKDKEGVQTTSSGLQYKFLKQGGGGAMPSAAYGLVDASCLCCSMPEMLAYESSWVHVCGHVMSSWNRRRTVGDSSRESLTDLARLAFTCW